MVNRTAGRLLSSVAVTVTAIFSLSWAANAHDMEVFAELQQGPGNITVTPDNRIIVSLHQFYSPDVRVVELLADGSVTPFPNAQWAGPRDQDGVGLTAVLGLRSDRNGIVWLLDNGGGPGGDSQRLVGWDTTRGALHAVIEVPPPATTPQSFHNDLALDATRNMAYLADVAGAIVAVDLDSGDSRRLLADHPSTRAEDVDFVVRGEVLAGADGAPLRIGLNPITISPDDEWVYYGAMNGTTVWRVPAGMLANPDLSDADIGRHVERYGDKPPSDGISVDAAGNVYVTDGGGNAIGVTRPDGTYSVLFADARIEWPDGISAGPDGWMYATVNRLNDTPPLNAGESAAPEGPYTIIRFRPLADAPVGR